MPGSEDNLKRQLQPLNLVYTDREIWKIEPFMAL